MLRTHSMTVIGWISIAVLMISLTGCTSVSEYVRNGFKVGPNYGRPSAPVSCQWIDQADVRVRTQSNDLSRWWTVFNDPLLNNLVACAYQQNLTLKEAGLRVLQARYLLAISTGELFPQSQSVNGSYTRSGSGVNFADRWNFNFNLAWELDFWGRFRRAVLASEDQLNSSVASYDDVLVTLLADVAQNYVLVRTSQERIRFLRANVEVQREILELAKRRVRIGTLGELDIQQAESTLLQSEAAIPQLEVSIRQATNRLCVLMGMPPTDLQNLIGTGSVPTSPPDVVVGIPAELLRRRPDIRRAEWDAAAQAEQIGIAEADLYPAFQVSGSMGYSARNFADLFKSQSFVGSVGPSFNWNVLNYGRIINNVKVQDARFQELVVAYQNTVLLAQEEVENGIVTFLKAQASSKLLDQSVRAAEISRSITLRIYEEGRTGFDFNRYITIEQNLISQQDSWAQVQGQIAQGLIAVYRALGGGWEMRFNPPAVEPVANPAGQAPGGAQAMPEEMPIPLPNPNNAPQQQP